MDRRNFLGLSAATVALSFERSAREGVTLVEAEAHAAKRGKPLLAIVVPDDGQVHGKHFGQVLAHGDDATLAALATVEVACIRAEELVVPEDTYLVLFEPGHAPRTLSRLGFTAERLVAFLHPDPEETLGRWMRYVPRAGSRPQHIPQRPLGLHAFSGRPRTAEVDAHAAEILFVVHANETWAPRELWLGRLANAAAVRLWDGAPLGGEWVTAPVDAQRPDPCPTCGLGFAPRPSRDFLKLYTR